MQPHLRAKLVRFGQIWLGLGKIKAKFGKKRLFGQIWLGLGKIRQSLGKKD